MYFKITIYYLKTPRLVANTTVPIVIQVRKVKMLR